MHKVTQIFALATGMFAGAPLGVEAQSVSHGKWGAMPDGREVNSFVLESRSGLRAEVNEYGAMLRSLEVPDREGQSVNVIFSHADLEEAIEGSVYGSIIGRFANRIDTGGFTIDGERFDLESVHPNSGVHIHGGRTGFHRQVWTGRSGVAEGEAYVVLRLESEDGHEGYPGKVEVEVTYRLTRRNALRIEYRGSTDSPTHLNLTNHAYFNLSGAGDVTEQFLRLDSAAYLDIDDRKVPTGTILPVARGLFDFREATRIGDRIGEVDGGGYDHCFVVHGWRESGGVMMIATLSDPVSGRVMEVATTKPGVQIFTANHFKGGEASYPRWGGICFETQYFPDAPNKPSFPSSLLRPGEKYEHVTEFRFREMNANSDEGESNPRQSPVVVP